MEIEELLSSSISHVVSAVFVQTRVCVSPFNFDMCNWHLTECGKVRMTEVVTKRWALLAKVPRWALLAKVPIFRISIRI